ncbi:hypothetical protein [Prosthecobacter sp.]|uniref:hypothetical protein n=1 Tax=Prosthecobacter sp. TaxID=1965333 RepID=UPI003784194B
MKTRSKLIQIGGLVTSLALLAGYVIYAQSKGRTEARETKEEFVFPSSKSLTSPVFSTSKANEMLKTKYSSANPAAAPAEKP